MVESRQSTADRSPIPGLARLEKAVLDGFGQIVNPAASSLVGAIRYTSYFGRQDHSGTRNVIVIDRRALLLGILEFGLAEPRKHSTSTWLVQWMTADMGCGPAQLSEILGRHESARANTLALGGGASIVLSHAMQELLPEALELAERSVKRSVIDLRHLVFALLRSPGDEWDVLPKRPTAGQFAHLRQQIVEEIAAHPEEGENVEAWKALLPVEPEKEPGTGTASGGPGGTLVIDERELHKMREAFLARFPDFQEHGFDASEGSYWEVERRYKQELIDATEEALQPVFKPGADVADIGAALLGVLQSKASNLLDWRELRRLDDVRKEAPGLIERALGEMAASPQDPAERIARCIEEIAEAYLKGQEENRPFAHLRTLPTTAFALAWPTEAIAVRYTTMHRASVRLTGRSLFSNAPMTAREYQIVLDIALHIEKVMREAWGWRPRDFWDVQSFLWVATEADKPADLPDEGQIDQGGGPTVQDRYRTQADDPAMVDALERGPFAAVLAARIVEIRKSARSDEPDGDRAFMVHLHGPWGSGKSSILNLLRKELEQPNEGEPSLVVMFNAWKQQRMRPPWWALMNAIYRGATARCASSEKLRTRWGERLRLWRLWWSWRWKAEWLPILLVGLLLGGLTFFLWGAETRSFVETAAKIGATAAVALGGVYAYARLMVFGSQRAVQAYADLTTDPYRRIVELFNRLVAEIEPPLVVFIDDLDRCDSDYVVELLEGIQTLFRHAPVTYVVAADRKWICSSFEKKYGDFAGSIGEPCRPLGYLFLDKLFQISAEMPRLTREVQASYLAALLREEPASATALSPELIAEAEERVSGISNEADLQQLIAEDEAQIVPAETRKESLDRHRALRHAAALQITSAEAAAETEHRLQKLSHLLEPNPRSMKRLVNAVGMAQARGLLEGRAASPETRARWAMLSLRWPILAEFLADNPAAVAHWRRPKGKTRRAAAADASWPAAVKALHGDRAVSEVVGDDGEEGALTPETLAPLLA